MSCICPPGTKSSFSQSIGNIFGDAQLPLPDLQDSEYLRGISLYVQFPDYCGQRFSIGDFVAPVRLYEAGFVSFVQGELGNLPEIDIQWSKFYLYVPEGATAIRIWVNVGFFVTLDFDVWNCPVEEPIPPPPVDPGSGGGAG